MSDWQSETNSHTGPLLFTFFFFSLWYQLFALFLQSLQTGTRPHVTGVPVAFVDPVDQTGVGGRDEGSRLSSVIRPECGWQSPASGGLIGSRASPLPPSDGRRIAASSGTRSSLRGGYLTLSFHRPSSPLQRAKRFIFGERVLAARRALKTFLFFFFFNAAASQRC